MYPLRASVPPPILDIPGSRFLGNIFIFKILGVVERVSIGIRTQPRNRGIPVPPLGSPLGEIVAPGLDGEAHMGFLDEVAGDRGVSEKSTGVDFWTKSATGCTCGGA